MRDHGPGPAEARRRRSSSASIAARPRGPPAVRGPGLGLPIARELARRWGGDVTLRAGARAAAPSPRSGCRRPPLPNLHRTASSLRDRVVRDPPRPGCARAAAPAPPVGVIVLALVGLVLAAGVTYAASTLVSQPIGLTSEPATAGDSLAPATHVGDDHVDARRRPTATRPSPTTTPTTDDGARRRPRRPATTTTTAAATATTTTVSGGGDDDDDDDD